MAVSTIKTVICSQVCLVFMVRITLCAFIPHGNNLPTNDIEILSSIDDEPTRQHKNSELFAENSNTLAEAEAPHSVTDFSQSSKARHILGMKAFDVLRANGTEHKKRHNKQHGRRQRKRRQLAHQSQHYGGLPRKSCQTKSAFVFHKEALDIFGNTVMLHPSIHVNGVAIDQYFYETFCDKEACACSGIDKDNFRSACETTYSFTYARVIKQGEIGWTQIMMRSGCSCVIHERKQSRRAINIMDSI